MTCFTTTLLGFLILLVITEGLVAGTISPSPSYQPVPGPPGRDGRDGEDGSSGVLSYEDYIELKEMIINDVISETLVESIKQEVVSAVDSLKTELKEMIINDAISKRLVETIKQEVVSAVDSLKTEMQCCRNETPPPMPVFRDCRDALNNSYTQSGIYTIQPDSLPPFDVYCDMDTDGGGWTVFQRRAGGNVDFYRNWVNYTNGFGNLSSEFWLGLEFIHRLTNESDSELRVDLLDWSSRTGYAKYPYFKIGDASTSYTLNVSGYSGNALDGLSLHSGWPFTTYDRDNDGYIFGNCAIKFTGAWWYTTVWRGTCHKSNLNGAYYDVCCGNINGVTWAPWRGFYYSLLFSEMKVRTRDKGEDLLFFK